MPGVVLMEQKFRAGLQKGLPAAEICYEGIGNIFYNNMEILILYCILQNIFLPFVLAHSPLPTVPHTVGSPLHLHMGGSYVGY